MLYFLRFKSHFTIHGRGFSGRDGSSSNVKGTVSLISCDALCQDGNGRFITIPFVWSRLKRFSCFSILPLFIFISRFPCEFFFVHFWNRRRHGETHRSNHFCSQKNDVIIHIFWSDEGFTGTVSSWELASFYGGSLKITLTVPLTQRKWEITKLSWIIE